MRPTDVVRTAAVLPLWCASAVGLAWWLALYAPFIAADKIHELLTGRRP